MSNRQIRVRPFVPPPNAAPLRIPLRRVPIIQVTNGPAKLWQMHYDYAIEQGNTHAAAQRYANCICR